MRIESVSCEFEREPLAAPFGFKGSYGTDLWISAAALRAKSGNVGIGINTQSPLWSDAEVFRRHSQAASNGMMFLTSAHAARLATEVDWDTPPDLLEKLEGPVHEHAKKITGNPELRLTFALNALVAVDNAAWQLYSRENGLKSFDEMIPAEFRGALSHRHDKLACIPLMSYGVELKDISRAVEDGFFFIKIKIGSDPDKDGSLDKMLDWDRRRLTEIHNAVKDKRTEHTDSGLIPYYLDANGRYDSKDRLKKLLEHASDIGALDRIMLLEEPFEEENKESVGDLPVTVAADESAHCEADVRERMGLGYKAIALKPIAKTMSMSLKIAKMAHENNIPCFCADLTVSPISVDWNKNVAARLKPLPGMRVGVLESNGHQNYRDWEKLKGYHPCKGAEWTRLENGLFKLGDDFYRRSGGILETSEHYKKLLGV